MRYLGVDFGMKRVGTAISDPSGSLVLPYETLVRNTGKDLVESLVRIIHSEGIETLVVGLPLTEEGQEQLTTRQARNFARELKKESGLPVFLVDETLTSFEAEQQLLGTGIKPAKRKAVLDQLAAARILEMYLSDPERAVAL
ncbi:MAG: Holliday junction resolvase RuvX [Desulfovibrionales bacterium]